MSVRSASLPVVACLLAIACSSSSGGNGGGSLDCAWLSGSSDCWRSTAQAASSCLPPSNATGTLSSDMKTCTYSTGQVVTFSEPLTFPLPSQPILSFSITNGGSPCLTWRQSTSDAYSFTTSAGTVSTGIAGSSETITCPDGSGASASVAQALSDLSCDAGGLGGLPGTAIGSSTGSVSFSILGVSSGSFSLFNCSM